MTDYEEPVKRPFTDLTKLAVGILLSILPVVNLIPVGYALENSGLGKNRKKKLPEWDNLWHLFKLGLKALAINVAYMAPFILIATLGFGILIGDILGVVAANLNTTEGLGALSREEMAALVTTAVGENFAQFLPGAVTMSVFWMAAMVLLLVASYLTPMAVMNTVSKKKLGEAFDFSLVFRKAVSKEYLAAWVVVLLIKLASKMLFSWIPVVGVAAAFFIPKVIAYNIYGQVYRKVR